MLSGIGGDKARARKSGRGARWPWWVLLALVVLAAVLWLGFSGVFSSGPATSATTLAASGHSAEVQRAIAADVASSGEVMAGTRASGGAVILPDQPGVAATVAQQAVPAAPATTGKDTAALSQIFNPAAEHSKAAPAPRRAARATGKRHDADVALLTDLLTHVEAGTPAERHALDRIQGIKPVDPIQAKMMKCPAPNTEKGLKCRQRVCVGHAGESPACPQGASDASSASADSEPVPAAARAEVEAPPVVAASARPIMAAASAPAAAPVARPMPAVAHRVAPGSARVATAASASRPAGVTRGVNVLRMAAAQYPPEAARNQSSGYATVEFTVTAQGTVAGAHVVSSNPRRVFDQAAIDAIRRSRFAPAMKNGQPVAAVVRRRIDFNLASN